MYSAYDITKEILSPLHQDRHPKSLVRLRICTFGAVNCVMLVSVVLNWPGNDAQ